MLKVANANVASAAKQAADHVGIMAMVNMKIASAARIVRPAAGAFTILFGEKFFISAKRQSISCSERMIFSRPWVGRSPASRLLGYFSLVSQSPFVVAFVTARFAILIQAMQRCPVGVELATRFRLVAARTKLLWRIGKSFLNHLCLPTVDSSTLLVLASQ